MSDEANQLRLIAADIIHKLWMAGETTQLELLAAQAKASVEDPYSPYKHTEMPTETYKEGSTLDTFFGGNDA